MNFFPNENNVIIDPERVPLWLPNSPIGTTEGWLNNANALRKKMANTC